MLPYALAHPLSGLNVVRQQLALSTKVLHNPLRKAFRALAFKKTCYVSSQLIPDSPGAPVKVDNNQLYACCKSGRQPEASLEFCSMKHVFIAAVLLLALWATLSILKTAVVHPATSVPSKAAAPSAKATEEPMTAGRKLFQANCQACHALDKALTGPALRGLTARGPWGDRKELYKWVHNPSAYMANDPYTKGLQQQYGATMTPFPQLNEKDIDDIVDYIEGKAIAAR
jgi:mono/diheme cytochrome c family protein